MVFSTAGLVLVVFVFVAIKAYEAVRAIVRALGSTGSTGLHVPPGLIGVAVLAALITAWIRSRRR